MQRNLEYNAIVLKITKFGEGHALVDFLIQDDKSSKLIKAFFYGLKKTKKNYGLMQFQSGRLWLYFNPVKNTFKVIDFQATNIRVGISESLVRFWNASLACEITLKMHGNMDFILLTAFLDGISNCCDLECKMALLRFLWRFINYSGIAPNYMECSSCGISFSENSELAYFETTENEFYCSSCISSVKNIKLSVESQNFLKSIETKPASISRKIVLNSESQIELREFLFFLLHELVGSKLNTLEAKIIG